MRTLRIFGALCCLNLGSLALGETVRAPIKATSMVFCPQDHRIYATGASDAKGDLANSLCRIDPDSGKIEGTVFVGDEPSGIIRSQDGKFLYVLVSGKRQVCQIDRATLKPGRKFPVGEGLAARGMAPIPEVPNGIVVLRYNPSVSPSGDNLCAFIEGRPMVEGVGCGGTFAFGIDPSRIITSADGSSPDFYLGTNAMLHTENGASFFNGYQEQLVASGYGLVFSGDGQEVDPEAREIEGRIKVETGQICIDPIRPVAYELYKKGGKPTVRCWDIQTFRNLWEAALPTWQGEDEPRSPLRYGNNGFAYMDGDSIVCGPWSLPPAANPVDLSVDRQGFPKEVGPGSEFTYKLVVKNNSDFPSNGAYLTDTIPGAIYVLETTPSQGTANYASNVIRASLGDIPAHGSATLKVKLRIQDRGNGGFVAVVRSFNPDPDTTNNIYPGTSFTPHAALALGNGPDGGLNEDWAGLSRSAQGAGDNLQISISGDLKITNNGKKPTQPTVVRFYLQDGPNLVVDWAILLQEVGIPALSPGETYTAELRAPVTTDSDIVGMYVIGNLDPQGVNGHATNIGSRIR